MRPHLLATLGDISQMSSLLTGPSLAGLRNPRIAFVGRSNVGKSSMINRLLGEHLAYTSQTPGKTRSILFYHWSQAKKILADLPGYGFAKASHSERRRWENFIESYLKKDENLEKIVVLLDSRHGPTQSDLEAITFLDSMGVPMVFVFTKADQLSKQSERALRMKEGPKLLESLGFKASKELGNLFWVSQKDLKSFHFLSKALMLKQEVCDE